MLLLHSLQGDRGSNCALAGGLISSRRDSCVFEAACQLTSVGLLGLEDASQVACSSLVMFYESTRKLGGLRLLGLIVGLTGSTTYDVN